MLSKLASAAKLPRFGAKGKLDTAIGDRATSMSPGRELKSQLIYTVFRYLTGQGQKSSFSPPSENDGALQRAAKPLPKGRHTHISTASSFRVLGYQLAPPLTD